MPVTLVAWELGRHYGHVLPLLPVARRLRERGHEVVFALRRLHELGPLLQREGFELLQAPAAPGRWRAAGEPGPPSMAALLLEQGYADAEVLGAHLGAWRALMRRTGCRQVVASYAPTALLAARTLGLAATAVGMPFELPPPVVPSPPFEPEGAAPPAAGLAAAETALVAAVNRALQPHGHRIAASHEVFAAGRQWIWSFAELDPHRALRGAGAGPGAADPIAPWVGPLVRVDEGEPPHWPAAAAPRVFGYLRHPPALLRPLLQALARMPGAFSLVVPDLDEAELAALRGERLALTRRPVRLDAALAAAEAVLCHGGHGTVCASLLAGRPLVLTPLNQADATLARRVAALGAARLASPTQPAAVAEACRALLAEPAPRAAAQRFAAAHAGFSHAAQVERFAEALAEPSVSCRPGDSA